MADTLVTRSGYLDRLAAATRRTPVTSLLGPRQCGKTTLARQFAATRNATFFDLESDQDVRRLANPELVLGVLDGLVVVDEIQRMPQLFNVLRVLADRPGARTRFLILGSASPGIVRGVSESLAGRVEFIDMTGFDLSETGTDAWRTLWLRGGLPRSYLAPTDDDGHSWRRSFVRTFLERDIPQLGITVPAAALERFWTMLAHWHGQTWNASSLGRSMSASDKTVRGYVDLLTGAFMVRQLQPWYQNVAKRQVKAPKDLPPRHRSAACVARDSERRRALRSSACRAIVGGLRDRTDPVGPGSGSRLVLGDPRRRRAGPARNAPRPPYRIRSEVQRGAPRNCPVYATWRSPSGSTTCSSSVRRTGPTRRTATSPSSPSRMWSTCQTASAGCPNPSSTPRPDRPCGGPCRRGACPSPGGS